MEPGNLHHQKSDQSHAFRVGFFMLFGLFVTGILILVFAGKENVFSWGMATISLRTTDCGDLKRGADVRLSGCRIGFVQDFEWKDQAVVISIKYDNRKYPLYPEYEFSIDFAGILGESYILIKPPPDGVVTSPLTTGHVVKNCRGVFNIQDAARNVMDLIKDFGGVLNSVTGVVKRIDHMLVTTQNLEGLTTIVSNAAVLTAKAPLALDKLDGLITVNSNALNLAISNLPPLSSKGVYIASQLEELLRNHRPEIESIVTNLDLSSQNTRQLLGSLVGGEGVVASLLTNQMWQSNFTLLVSNLTLLSRNINQHGLPYKPRGWTDPGAQKGK